MAKREHSYTIGMKWTGNTGQGTQSYTSYSRNHEYMIAGKPVLPGSSDPAFRGDPTRYSPEDLLVASISSCHMLWYLHLCAVNGIVVTAYEDKIEATMEEDKDGSGRFTDAVLKPQVKIASGDIAKAESLHHEAHRLCFVAQSLNFPVRCEGKVEVE